MAMLLWLQPGCYREAKNYLNYLAKVTWCLNSSKTGLADYSKKGRKRTPTCRGWITFL